LTMTSSAQAFRSARVICAAMMARTDLVRVQAMVRSAAQSQDVDHEHAVRLQYPDSNSNGETRIA
jgi:hypothetical protein